MKDSGLPPHYSPPSSNLRVLLARTASGLAQSPGLSADDVQWLRQYALRLLIVETASDDDREETAA